MIAYEFRWSVLWQQPYGSWMLDGVWTTIQLGFISWVFALFIGILIGTFRVTPWKPLRAFATAYTEFFRDIPLLVQLFFWYFAAPRILPASLEQYFYREVANVEFWIVVIALSIYTSSRVGEQIRSGLQSIPVDQFHAALSTGLTYFQMYRYVTIPLAVRIMIPPLTTEFLTTFKNTSLAMTVGVLEATFMSQQIEAYTFRGLEATTAACLVYLAITMVVILFMALVEKRLSIPGFIARNR
ncbi:MAG: amino acid ABC transporter permease [Deltaproteobacteria bacterium]|nr:amino acid ABC transporter permease [Deltaproteobacteria bacterium]